MALVRCGPSKRVEVVVHLGARVDGPDVNLGRSLVRRRIPEADHQTCGVGEPQRIAGRYCRVGKSVENRLTAVSGRRTVTVARKRPLKDFDIEAPFSFGFEFCAASRLPSFTTSTYVPSGRSTSPASSISARIPST